MKWKFSQKFQNKVFLCIVLLSIMTILVYTVFMQWPRTHSELVYKNIKSPPKTKLDPMEWGMEYQDPHNFGDTVDQSEGMHVHDIQEGFDYTGSKEDKYRDDTKTTFIPSETPSSLGSSDYGKKRTNEHDGDIMEGFGIGIGDFGKFLGFFFEAILALICFIAFLPFHIFEFAIGMYYLVDAFFMLIIGLIRSVGTVFMEINMMLHDMASCGMTWSQNLRYCAVWYFIEFLGYLFMVFAVWLPTALIRIFTFNMVDTNNMFVGVFGVAGSGYRDTNGHIIQQDGVIAQVSKSTSGIFGFDFMHFPPTVVEKCYQCDLVRKFFKVVYDSTIGVLSVFGPPMNKASQSIPWLWHAFYLDAFTGKGSFCSP